MPPRQGGRSPVVPYSEAISAPGAEWRALFVGAREWALFGAAQAVPLGGARARGLAADILMFCRSDVVGNRHAYRSLAHAGHTLGRLGSSGSSASPPEPLRGDFSGQRSEHRRPNALYLPPRGRPREGGLENGASAARRPARPARRRSPLPRCRKWAAKTEYRRQGSSLTPPAEKPGLRPPPVLQQQMGHHAPPAAPWRQCDTASTSTDIREYRRSSSECSRLSTMSRARPIHGQHRRKPAQHRQAVSADQIRDARATASQIGTDSDSDDVRI